MTTDPTMRAMTAILLTSALTLFGAVAGAEAGASAATRHGLAAPSPTDVSAQQRRRPRVRIYREYDDRGVYPRYFPGANAVRDCNVTYVREFRPSGTVIVPNMKCFWRQP